MADEDEDLTIDLRLRDYLTGNAATAAHEMDELAEATKRAGRALLLLDKRADKAAKSLARLAVSTREARMEMNKLDRSFNGVNAGMNRTTQNQQTLGRNMIKTTALTNRQNRANDRLRRSFTMLTRAIAFATAGLAMLSKGLALVGAAAIAGVAAQQLLAVAAALATMASFAALLPVALGGLVAVVATGIVAFKGLGEAIKAAASGDAKALEEAMKKLGPNAQRFVKELTPALKVFKGLKKDVTDALVRPLGKEIPNALRNLQPTIRSGMKSIANEFGLMFKQIGIYFSSSEGKRMFGRFFESGRQILALFSRNTLPFLTSLGRLIEAAMPFWNRFVKALDGGFEKFNQWMQDISADGRLESWLETAFTVAKQLGDILGNVGGIIKGVVGAAGGAEGGAGALGAFADALGKLNEYVNSLAGQTALTSFFSTMAGVLNTVWPIIEIVANTLGNVLIPALGDVISGLGPGVTVFFQALSTALSGILPYVGPLASAIGGLIGGLAPLLEPIGKLVQLIGAALTPVIQILTPIISMLASVIGAILTPVIDVLLSAFAAIQPYIPMIVDGFNQVGATLIPVFQELGSTIAGALAPLLDQLVEMLPTLIPQFVELATSVGEFLANALTEVMPLISALIGFLVGMWQRSLALWPIVLHVVNAIVWLGNAILPVIGFVADIIAALVRFATAVNKTATDVILWFGNMLGKIKEIPGVVSNAFSSVKNAIVGPFKSAYNSVVGVIDDIRNAISNLDVGAMISNATDAINPFRFAGGSVRGGKSYTIGEIGPEMFIGSNGATKLIGEHGMDKNWRAPGDGTIIPSYMLDAVNRATDQLGEFKPGNDDGSPGSAMLAEFLKRFGGDGGGEVHHHHVSVVIQGDVSREVDIERAVNRAISKIERDRKERR